MRHLRNYEIRKLSRTQQIIGHAKLTTPTHPQIKQPTYWRQFSETFHGNMFVCKDKQVKQLMETTTLKAANISAGITAFTILGVV